ncbi:tetratricopeptide repeat protein, partial [Fusobacterium simiae]|uniref:tetratricopeptide repeat protein n=1 Tax=Fusobacterium simiae TaxID=855 RepID=UPI00235018DF
NMDKKEIIQLLKNLNKEEANKIYEEYLESNFKILEKIEENDYEVLDNIFYVGEGNLDKGKLDKQNKFLDNYGLEIVENEIGLMITEKKDFYYNIFKNYVSDDYRDFFKLHSEDVDYIDYVSSFDKYSEIIANKIVAWENFLEKYPDSKLEKKANDICQSYRVDYITSLIFPSTTEALINGRSNRAVEELNRFIKKYPNSPTTKIIKFYLENYKNEDINDILADKIEEIYSKGE